MLGIYGQTFIDSFAPGTQQFAWENRCLDRLAIIGSTEWRLIWRAKRTKLGRLICRLHPSTRLTNATGSIGLQTGWPTPRASPNENHNTQSAPTHGETHGETLAGVSQDLMSGWTTPQTHDSAKPDMSRHGRYGTKHGGRNLNDEAALAGWATPVVPNGGRHPKDGKMNGTGQTPDGKKRQVDLNWQIRGLITPSLDPIVTDATVVLNPELPRWLLGFPRQVLSLAPSATQFASR